MVSETITLNNNFELKEKIYNVDCYSAHTILGSKKQYKITEAVKDKKNDVIRLKKHFLICPKCQHHFPAYDFFDHDEKPNKKFNIKTAYEWCCQQSFFDDDEKKIQLFKPFEEGDIASCPICSFEGVVNSLKKSDFLFSSENAIIKIRTNLNSLREVIEIDWIKNVLISVFPLTETVTFDFNNGDVSSVITTANGEIIFEKDLTYSDFKTKSKIINAINSNGIIKTKLVTYFEKEWNNELPFKNNNELNFKTFLYMCLFVGYPKNFYNNIPLIFNERDNLVFSHSFNKKTSDLHNINNLPEIVKKSSIPNSKSIKKIIYENPALAFYIQEIEIMCSVLGDINHIRTFLSCDNILDNLSIIHNYNKVIEFYSDFIIIKGTASFLKHIEHDSETMNKYAIIYSALNTNTKKSKLKNSIFKKSNYLNEIKKSLTEFDNIQNFDYEIFNKRPTLKKVNLNGFYFCYLNTKNDFLQSGEELNNCLGIYRGNFFEKTSIICMKKNGKTVAAFEISLCGEVIQAHIKNNDDISHDPAIFTVFKKFCKINDFVYDEVI